MTVTLAFNDECADWEKLFNFLCAGRLQREGPRSLL